MSPTWNPLNLPEHELRSLRDAGRINDYGITPAPVHPETRSEVGGARAPASRQDKRSGTPLRLVRPDPALSCSSCRALPVRVHAIEPPRNEATGHKPPALYRCAWVWLPNAEGRGAAGDLVSRRRALVLWLAGLCIGAGLVSIAYGIGLALKP